MRTIRRVPRLLAAALPLLLAACGRDGSTTEPAEQPSTADIFTEISRSADMNLWFVEAHEQTKN